MAKVGTIVEFNRGSGPEYGIVVGDGEKDAHVAPGFALVAPLGEPVSVQPAEGETVGGGEFKPVG